MFFPHINICNIVSQQKESQSYINMFMKKEKEMFFISYCTSVCRSGGGMYSPMYIFTTITNHHLVSIGVQEPCLHLCDYSPWDWRGLTMSFLYSLKFFLTSLLLTIVLVSTGVDQPCFIPAAHHCTSIHRSGSTLLHPCCSPLY